MGRRTTLEEAFTRRVDVRGPDECWPWTGAVDRDGYGLFGLRPVPGGPLKMYKAHVVAYTLANGAPPKRQVLHRCNNEPCCNPADLYEGDPADNAADRVAAGTVRSSAALTAEAVRAIRAEAPTTMARWRELAGQHGVSAKTIENVVKGRTWRDDYYLLREPLIVQPGQIWESRQPGGEWRRFEVLAVDGEYVTCRGKRTTRCLLAGFPKFRLIEEVAA